MTMTMMKEEEKAQLHPHLRPSTYLRLPEMCVFVLRLLLLLLLLMSIDDSGLD